MKTLQNNFTTPEQSRRLLESGLPADSADCYISYNVDKEEEPNDFRMGIRQNEVETAPHFVEHELPCWSVGRLIEILKICMTSTLDFIDIIEKVRLYEDSLQILVQAFSEYEDVIDFSKLDD